MTNGEKWRDGQLCECAPDEREQAFIEEEGHEHHGDQKCENCGGLL